METSGKSCKMSRLCKCHAKSENVTKNENVICIVDYLNVINEQKRGLENGHHFVGNYTITAGFYYQKLLHTIYELRKYIFVGA
jgi:hypothetical protein